MYSFHINTVGTRNQNIFYSINISLKSQYLGIYYLYKIDFGGKRVNIYVNINNYTV